MVKILGLIRAINLAKSINCKEMIENLNYTVFLQKAKDAFPIELL